MSQVSLRYVNELSNQSQRVSRYIDNADI